MGINEGGAVGESLNATATATVSVSTAIFEKAVAGMYPIELPHSNYGHIPRPLPFVLLLDLTINDNFALVFV